MAIKSGLAAQAGLKVETTYGTAVTVDRFFPLVSESMTEEIARLESQAILAGRRILDSEQSAAGNVNIAGDLGFELFQQNTGVLWQVCLGAVSTTGAGPYTHDVTPGDLSDDFFTLQIGKPDMAGTVQPFTFASCMVSEWELAAKAGEIPTFGMSVVGKNLATGTALASASYGDGDAVPFTFSHATVEFATTATPVKEFTLKGNNGLDTERYFLGDDERSQPIEADHRTYDGEAMLEFSGLTQYNRFRNHTETALEFLFNAGSSAQCNITLNVRFDGSTPTVDGKGIVTLNAPFKVLGDGSDADGITVEVINSDSAA